MHVHHSGIVFIVEQLVNHNSVKACTPCLNRMYAGLWLRSSW
jgi:hypothetical protein